MSADSRATSVPEIPIAMPISASNNAGASFAPSPVTATVSPFDRSTRTILSFCSGVIRAKTTSGASRTLLSSSSETSASL
ncbi:Uncharacterised protein [uncultured archaeon]|nr:Uncharacterised protein [uncultured archaeon]